jgi:group I intron endonuclease
MWYNSYCHAEQNTRALCYPEAAQLSQLDIVGKVPSINGFRPVLAVPRDNGSAICEGHFAMNEKRLYYLYLYRNRDNGKAYIGVTGDLERRKRKHAEGKSGSRYFNHTVIKYGVDIFDFGILAIFDDVNAANHHENAAITSFGTLSPAGYNLIGGAPCSRYHGAHSQETREKIGNANKGRIISEEQLEKMSAALRGRPSPNRGKTFSPEYRKKLSEGHNGKGPSSETQEKMNATRRTPESREKASNSHKGMITPEQREKMIAGLRTSESREKVSKAHKGRSLSPEHREKISNGNMGRVVTPETREKISIGRKGITHSLEARIKMSIGHKGKKLFPEHIEKVRKHLIGRPCSQETRDKIANAQKGRTLSPERLEKMSKARKGVPWTQARRDAAERKKKGV